MYIYIYVLQEAGHGHPREGGRRVPWLGEGVRSGTIHVYIVYIYIYIERERELYTNIYIYIERERDEDTRIDQDAWAECRCHGQFPN